MLKEIREGIDLVWWLMFVMDWWCYFNGNLGLVMPWFEEDANVVVVVFIAGNYKEELLLLLILWFMAVIDESSVVVQVLNQLNECARIVWEVNRNDGFVTVNDCNSNWNICYQRLRRKKRSEIKEKKTKRRKEEEKKQSTQLTRRERKLLFFYPLSLPHQTGSRIGGVLGGE